MNGCKLVDNEKKADVIIFHTCAFNEIRKDECFELIEKYNKHQGELIITGCLPGIAPEELDRVFDGRVLVTRDIENIGDFFPNFKVKYQDVPDANCPYQSKLTFNVPWVIKKNLISDFKLNRQYVRKLKHSAKLALKVRKRLKKLKSTGFLRISHGCVSQCAYCAIHSATGRLKSKPMEDIVIEYENLLDQGIRNIEFAAESSGPYGLDLKTNLPALLHRLHEVDKKKNVSVKWNLECIDPKWTTKYMDELLKYIKLDKIDFIKADIQSGNQRILKQMKRHYTVQDIQNLKRFREAKPDIHLRSQFIAGFPSETEEEFQDTIDLILDIRFDTIQVFAYSDMEGTAASRMENKVPEGVIQKRLKKLQRILEENGYITFFSFTCLEGVLPEAE
jgi:tRNA A37 methylthiotransferase MiaB